MDIQAGQLWQSQNGQQFFIVEKSKSFVLVDAITFKYMAEYEKSKLQLLFENRKFIFMQKFAIDNVVNEGDVIELECMVCKTTHFVAPGAAIPICHGRLLRKKLFKPLSKFAFVEV